MITILYFARRISFGIISELKLHTTEYDVKHIEIDLQDAGSVIYIAGNNLYQLKLDLGEPVIDRLTKDGHLNNSWYPSFAQMDSNNIPIVDGQQHCLIWFDRSSCDKPQPLVGVCGKQGHKDGPIQQAHFNYPNHLVKRPDTQTFYLTENYYIRQIKFKNIDTATTILHHSSHAILSVALDFEGNIGYYTTIDRIQIFNFHAPQLNIKALSFANMIGHLDGPLKSSHYNEPSRMVPLNSKTLMITDKLNRCYRIVDLENEYVSSICNLEEKYDRPLIGSIVGCRLHNPATQLYLPHQSLILLTDGRFILKLNVTGKAIPNIL